MEKQVNAKQSSNDDETICGMVSVIFSADLGPELGTNLSNLKLEAAIFLALRGFTALMAGVDYENHGPGKIRGIIEIPSTPYYAVGFDIVLKKREIEQDHRLFENSPALLFVIVHKADLEIIRRVWDNLEEYLTNSTKNLISIDELTEKKIIDLRKLLNHFLQKEKNELTETERKLTLFDVSVLLSFDSFTSSVAQTLMDLQTTHGKLNVTIQDIVEELNESSEEIDKALKKLVQMGYVTMTISDHPGKEPQYRAI